MKQENIAKSKEEKRFERIILSIIMFGCIVGGLFGNYITITENIFVRIIAIVADAFIGGMYAFFLFYYIVSIITERKNK